MSSTEYWKLIHSITPSERLQAMSEAKLQVLEKIITSLDIKPEKILFAGFNPLVLGLESRYQCQVIADPEIGKAWGSDSLFTLDLDQLDTDADICFALDEYFTYADSEIQQRQLLEDINSIFHGYLVTTLQDYKNAAPHRRNSVESMGFDQDQIMLEHYQIDKINRQNWQSRVMMITDFQDLEVVGPMQRRTMYFKQLAKYTSDLGGQDYMVQKNLLYKGYYKKYYEHIISVKFQ